MSSSNKGHEGGDDDVDIQGALDIVQDAELVLGFEVQAQVPSSKLRAATGISQIDCALSLSFLTMSESCLSSG